MRQKENQEQTKDKKEEDRFSNSDHTSASIVDGTPEQLILKKLQKAIKTCRKVHKNHSNEKVLNDKAVKDADYARQFAEDEIRRLKKRSSWNPSMDFKESVDDAFFDLEDWRDKLLSNLSRIQQAEEMRRLQPKSTLPKWYCDPASYLQFMERFEKAVEFKDDSQKMTDLQNCVVGEQSKNVIAMFRHCETELLHLGALYKYITKCNENSN